LLLSRSTMTRPRQPWTVSMLGVAMLGSFLVGYLNRALPALSRSRAITCNLLLLATANLDVQRYRRGMPTDGSQLRAGLVIGGLRHLSTSYRRSLAGAPPGQRSCSNLTISCLQ
jgi:hypothetical protein